MEGMFGKTGACSERERLFPRDKSSAPEFAWVAFSNLRPATFFPRMQSEPREEQIRIGPRGAYVEGRPGTGVSVKVAQSMLETRSVRMVAMVALAAGPGVPPFARRDETSSPARVPAMVSRWRPSPPPPSPSFSPRPDFHPSAPSQRSLLVTVDPLPGELWSSKDDSRVSGSGGATVKVERSKLIILLDTVQPSQRTCQLG